MAMSLPIALVLALSATAVLGGFLTPGLVGNTLIVKFGVTNAFRHMPRTLVEAREEAFEKAADRAVDMTTLWCPKNDYRVCLLFDSKGSVAGMQISVREGEIENAKLPLDLKSIPEWSTSQIFGVDVYSLVIFFVPKALLLSGGRDLTSDSLTAPEGLFFLQTDENSIETNRLHVSNEESAATSVGFLKQRCFPGMGNHYYQELSKNSTCEEYRPYFTLYNPSTHNLHGFGFNGYGKPDTGRWIETSTAFLHKIIAPNQPDCKAKWVKKYGLFALHVYFVDTPYFTLC